MTTPYHAKYFAYELTRQGGAGVERLSRSLFDASVDLNPHQVEAALFAMRSPLSSGALLADEVGLGKTIEAGIVLCEYWAERRRRLLVIVPASIRKQWALELSEKFHLPSLVIDEKSYRERRDAGVAQPFEGPAVVITSINFASRFAEELHAIPWDLVVVDEAHRLRNAYRQSNVMGQRIRWAIGDRRKLLLTATPLQNSLTELYGLSTMIDERLFGDLPSFRSQYMNAGANLTELRERLRTFSTRTLRRQVVEYVRYTERRLITRPFQPTENEQRLYEAISSFLQRDNTYALPQQQRHLMTLIVRKLLASSSQAVAGTLEAMRDRLVVMLNKNGKPAQLALAEALLSEEEMADGLLDEILGETAEAGQAEPGWAGTNGAKQDSEDGGVGVRSDEQVPPPLDRSKLEAEIRELNDYIRWARSIGVDTKARALLAALQIGFGRMTEMGAASRAVIFTESRRTQTYLKDFLDANGYAGKTVLFNGTNSDPETTLIYERWVEANRDLGRTAGSRQVNVRTAIIEHFRDQANIMIATEAAAEGINLQFCSLVVNFDLPWNPQRIEQRIGRCHRYGQEHDVVVINFLNERNAADQRVYELLNEKFQLFDGVFGASDEVLGSIESGVDFERRVLDIYQQCRTTEEIEVAFAALRTELDASIQTRVRDTRRILLENFDQDVHERLRANLAGTREQLDRTGRMFWATTRFVLDDRATFDDAGLTFDLLPPGVSECRPGRYHLITKDDTGTPQGQFPADSEFLYRLSHPLGEHVLEAAKGLPTPAASVTFDITGHPARIAVVEALRGRSGWLRLQRLAVDSFEREEYLLFSGLDDAGNSLDAETCEKLFNCAGRTNGSVPLPDTSATRLDAEAERHVKATISRSLEQNNRYFQEARERLEKWADDMVLAAERELKETKQQITALNRQSRQTSTLEEQHAIQEKIAGLERAKRRQRQRIFEVEDEVMAKRDGLISALERRMAQKTTTQALFTIHWTVA
jgi:superfamily II DNA or RNA helicase